MPFRSVRANIILGMVAVVVVCFGVAYLTTYVKIRGLLERELINDHSATLSQLAWNVEAVLRDVTSLAVDIVLDDELQKILRHQPAPGSYQSLKDSYLLEQMLKTYRFSRAQTVDIAIRMPNGDFTCNATNYDLAAWAEWYRLYFNDARRDVTGFSTVGQILSGYPQKPGYRSIICYSRPINDTHVTGQELGTLVIAIDKSVFDELLKIMAPPRVHLAIWGEENALLCSQDSSPADPRALDGADVTDVNGTAVTKTAAGLLVEKGLPNGWRITDWIPASYLTLRTREGLMSLILVAALGILVCSGIAALLVSYFTTSMRKLTNAMQALGTGDYRISLQTQGRDELEQLAEVFNTMVRRLHDLSIDVAQQERQKRELELRALLMQVNPHFLYNTLDSVISLARMQNPEGVIQVTRSLISLMQRLSSESDGFVTIEEEIAYLTEYIAIQRIRFGDVFTVSFDVEPDARHCRIPRLILQPLLENALYHGILPKEGKGLITVRVTRIGETLSISVSDNGVGADPQELSRLLTEDTPPSREARFSRVGLRTVRDRLQLIYGQEYSVSLEGHPSEGTVASFSVPIQAIR